MGTNITALRPKDRIVQDAGPVAAIYRDMGTAAAERVVTRALGELALAMSGLSARMRNHDLTDMGRQFRRLQSMAEQLGLVSLGHVAADARTCLEGGDSTAFAAVWARLVRVAEYSLAPDRDLLNQSL